MGPRTSALSSAIRKTIRWAKWGSGFAVYLGPPPADTHEEESPIVEEFRRLAFEGVPDELEDPPQNEESKSIEPQMVNEEGGHEDRDRDQD
jgi:hypothetical protein